MSAIVCAGFMATGGPSRVMRSLLEAAGLQNLLDQAMKAGGLHVIGQPLSVRTRQRREPPVKNNLEIVQRYTVRAVWAAMEIHERKDILDAMAHLPGEHLLAPVAGVTRGYVLYRQQDEIEMIEPPCVEQHMAVPEAVELMFHLKIVETVFFGQDVFQ